jgi:hypothetical protein
MKIRPFYGIPLSGTENVNMPAPILRIYSITAYLSIAMR